MFMGLYVQFGSRLGPGLARSLKAVGKIVLGGASYLKKRPSHLFLILGLISFDIGFSSSLNAESHHAYSAFIKRSYENPAIALLGEHRRDKYLGTLKEIKKRRFLRVLTTQNSFDYYLYKGRQKGFQYEMMKSFVHNLNKKFGYNNKKVRPIRFEMIPVDRSELFSLLNSGYGDLVASSFIEDERQSGDVAVSRGFGEVKKVLVSSEGMEFELNTIEDLSGLTIHVPANSSQFHSLHKINSKLVVANKDLINVIPVHEKLGQLELLELVSMGRFEFAVIDIQVAQLAKQVFSDFKIYDELELAPQSKIRWAVNPKNHSLMVQLNQFLVKSRASKILQRLIYRSYFRDLKKIRTEYFSKETQRISKYDEFFKKYGKKYSWDWRLLSALAYQESRFRQNIQNRWKATGIMQIKPFVAKEPYVNIPDIKGPTNFENNIHAGVKYLSWLKRVFFSSPDIDDKNSIRLSMAAYNAGIGRLRRAQAYAKKQGLDPNKWFGNVEVALLKMGYIEPVNYVSEINKRYLSYALMIDAPVYGPSLLAHYQWTAQEIRSKN